MSDNTTNDYTNPPPNATHKINLPAAYGWVCPVCGGGNSPFTTRCPCVPIGLGPVTC